MQPSKHAAAKDDKNNFKRPLQSYGNFWIPEYHEGSLPDDQEGVDLNNYNMSECQIDESNFGKQKYHKGALFSLIILFTPLPFI